MPSKLRAGAGMVVAPTAPNELWTTGSITRGEMPPDRRSRSLRSGSDLLLGFGGLGTILERAGETSCLRSCPVMTPALEAVSGPPAAEVCTPPAARGK